ncbi:MAG: hypothetical protein H8D34_28710 [Chloroflexi bacterium]|nr:hypothetical protein [Chloroflexota bacterium]
MTTNITDAQIEKWKNTYDEMLTDTNWISKQEERDQKRKIVRKEILDLFNGFQTGKITLDNLKETFDRKTRKDWDVFGFKGMSGAMFLNKLVIHIHNKRKLVDELKYVLLLPKDGSDGRKKLQSFSDYLEKTIRDGQVTRRAIQPARVPFLVSGIWHLQDLDTWPIYYISGRQALTREGFFQSNNNPVDDYFTFRTIFLQLANHLKLSSWEFEHVLAWYDNKQKEKPKKSETEKLPLVPVNNFDDEIEQTADAADAITHTNIQGLLAKIGRKLGCKVWIASNDKRKEWEGTTLGEMSIDQLPSLGLDPETQRIISLIDVLWIKGHNQVVAAFEVEHTTSVYSGLLRMSDLVASSPNLNFQLYIVTPETRIPKVRRQLSRPTFQMLEIHKQCGFFSFETLIQEADSILHWATDTIVIDKLAEKVDDVPLG